ncbi:peptidoglycan-associated lipoprotein Pal [Halioxenophilus aromaticivorans]|uniref:Peptidoglycan-associated lipoprotein n=1 Tax=Halioxenophilus aromaticivorans TaxID=1306992 RepID=A0AAV3TWN3_9ALTE
MKLLKTGFSLIVLAFVLAGCSSTEEIDTDQAATPVEEEVGSAVDTSGVDTSGIMEDEQMALETVFYFDFDQSVVKSDERALLTAHAEDLKANPRSVRLEGHADERGTREYNMALGERRANAIRDFLVLQGVDPTLIETVSYGEEQPAAYGSDEETWRLNRRVELK